MIPGETPYLAEPLKLPLAWLTTNVDSSYDATASSATFPIVLCHW